MSIKLKINLHTKDAEIQATKIANQLKDKNLRGVKVKQTQAKPKDGSLDVAEYLPIIELVIKSGLATAFVTQLVGLLKNGFFTKSKEIKSNERIKKAEIEANKETERLKLETDKDKHHENTETEIEKIKSDKEINLLDAKQKRDYIELAFECNDEKYCFKLTKDDEEQYAKIIDTITKIQNKCK